MYARGARPRLMLAGCEGLLDASARERNAGLAELRFFLVNG
jgi:hypothetical protein